MNEQNITVFARSDPLHVVVVVVVVERTDYRGIS